jgi:hypothetical protein
VARLLWLKFGWPVLRFEGVKKPQFAKVRFFSI